MTVQAQTDGGLEERTRTLYVTEYGPMLTSILGAAAVPVDAGQGLRARRRQLRELPLPQPLLRTNRAQNGRRVRPRSSSEFQGIPWVNSIAADRRGERLLLDGRRDPERDRRRRVGAWPRAAPARSGSPPSAADRDRRCWTAPTPSANWAPTPTRSRRGSSGPTGSRASSATTTSQRQRQPLALQPRGAADRLRPDHRRRGHRALAAHAARACSRSQERLDGTDGLPGNGFTLQQLCRRSRSATASTRASCGATSWSRCASEPDRRPARAARWTSAAACPSARGLGRPRRPRLERARSSSGASPRTCSPTSSSCRPGSPAASTPGSNAIWDQQFSRRRPGQHPERAQRRQPAGRPGARRRGHRPRRARGSRSTRRLRGYQYETRGGERIPIHGGPGTSGSSTRSTSTWDPTRGLPERPPRIQLHRGDGVPQRQGCPVAGPHLRHLRADARTRTRRTPPTTPAPSREKRWNRGPVLRPRRAHGAGRCRPSGSAPGG